MDGTDLSAERRREARRAFSRVGLALVVLLAVRELAVFGMQAAVMAFAPQLRGAWWMQWVLSLGSMYVFALPAMLLSLKGTGTSPRNTVCVVRGQETPMPPFRFGWWMVVAVVALGWMEFGGLIGNGLMSILSGLTGFDYKNGLDTVLDGSPLWASALFTCVAAPLGEELIFRKLLIDRTRRYGDATAILVSALFFALFHGNLFQFFYAFAVGILLGYVYTRTGRLWWNAALHAFINFYGGVLASALIRLVDPALLNGGEVSMEQLLAGFLPLAAYLLYAFANYAFMAASVVLPIVLRGKIRLGRGEAQLSRREALSAMINPGVLGALILSLAAILLGLIPGPAA